ncbi:MAG: DedA family protein [Candidatus Dojkabacteria bacterium]|nr:DedA family protein [Candidatus Dojkabacteria bacterium]
MFSSLANDLLGLIDSLGYFGVFLIMFLESGVFPPIPSEVILGSIGLLVYQGNMNFGLAVLAASLGNAAGTLFMYLVARIGGRPFINRYGDRLFVTQEKLDKGEVWVKKYGNVVIFFSQMIPGVRSLVTIPAGLLKKNVFAVCLYSFLGAAVWTSFIIGVTSKLGNKWKGFIDTVDKYSNVVMLLTLIIGLLFISYRVYSYKRKKLNN